MNNPTKKRLYDRAINWLASNAFTTADFENRSIADLATNEAVRLVAYQFGVSDIVVVRSTRARFLATVSNS